MKSLLSSYCPPSPPVTETRPEWRGSILTSTTALEPLERLRLWRAKRNILLLEAWRTRETNT